MKKLKKVPSLVTPVTLTTIDLAGSEGLEGLRIDTDKPHQKLSSSLILLTFITTHFFQFRFAVSPSRLTHTPKVGISTLSCRERVSFRPTSICGLRYATSHSPLAPGSFF